MTKNVFNLFGWTVIGILLAVGFFTAWMNMFYRPIDTNFKPLMVTPEKTASAAEANLAESDPSAKPRLDYSDLNEGGPIMPWAQDVNVNWLLFNGKYDEALEELKKRLPKETAIIRSLESPDDHGTVFGQARKVLQAMAETYELKGDWGAARKLYFLIYGGSLGNEVQWLDIRSAYSHGSYAYAFALTVQCLSMHYSSLDVDKTLRRAEESKARPSACFRIPVAHDLLDDEDVRVYALKDQLARVANPKLHYTYKPMWYGGGNEEPLRQAELSHESYLKFLESMEDVYQKIESGDDSVKVGGLPDRETCANVMVMLRKIGDLPY
ncbi:MAG: tetratricopeptide repeat protein [Thermoguttaceae bacterium]